MGADPTRRALIKRGLTVVAAHGDISVLRDLLALEQLMVLGYQRQLASRKLGTRSARVVGEFLAHEQAHAAALSATLRRLGGDPPAAPATATLSAPASAGQALGTLIALERDALGSYYRALGKLRDGRAALLAARIMATEAQHETGLSELLVPGHPKLSVPSPFAYGT
jgi:rubrerythrin